MLSQTIYQYCNLVITSHLFPTGQDEKLKPALLTLQTSCLCSVPDPPRLRDIPDLSLLCLLPHPNTTSARPNATCAPMIQFGGHHMYYLGRILAILQNGWHGAHVYDEALRVCSYGNIINDGIVLTCSAFSRSTEYHTLSVIETWLINGVPPCLNTTLFSSKPKVKSP